MHTHKENHKVRVKGIVKDNKSYNKQRKNFECVIFLDKFSNPTHHFTNIFSLSFSCCQHVRSMLLKRIFFFALESSFISYDNFNEEISTIFLKGVVLDEKITEQISFISFEREKRGEKKKYLNFFAWLDKRETLQWKFS